MSQNFIIGSSITVFSLILAISIFKLAAQQKISFRYMVGWLSICTLGIFSSAFSPLVEPISVALKVTPGALLAIVGTMFLMLICVQLTISISGMQQQIRRLTEEIALNSVQRPDENVETQDD